MTKVRETKQIVVAITGASGAGYAVRLVEQLCEADVQVHLIVSAMGRRLLTEELGLQEVSKMALIGRDVDHLTIHSFRDVGSTLASGSFRTDGMVVCPCSSNTLGAMAAGLGDNLICRAAAVTLKEMRRLILVTREMPMGRIDLLNALKLSEAGAVICPASPGFYMNPTSIDDLVDFVVGKMLDLLNIDHKLNTRWSDQLAGSSEALTIDQPGNTA